MTSHTYGRIGVQPTGNFEYLTLAFSPLSTPLRSRWRNNGLSADFLSDYVITFLPASGDVASERHQNDIRQIVSFIANELLENAMKYHAQDVETPIKLNLELSRTHVTVSASNGVNEDQAERYGQFVEHLLESDPNELLISRLEESAENSDVSSSGLGLLTMITDYQAELGWSFEVTTDKQSEITVTTSALISLSNILESAHE